MGDRRVRPTRRYEARAPSRGCSVHRVLLSERRTLAIGPRTLIGAALGTANVRWGCARSRGGTRTWGGSLGVLWAVLSEVPWLTAAKAPTRPLGALGGDMARGAARVAARFSRWWLSAVDADRGRRRRLPNGLAHLGGGRFVGSTVDVPAARREGLDSVIRCGCRTRRARWYDVLGCTRRARDDGGTALRRYR